MATKDKNSIDSYSMIPIHLDPQLIELTRKQTPFSSLIPKWEDPEIRRTKIHEVEVILRDIQKEIDYENQSCPCCGTHPDEVRF